MPLSAIASLALAARCFARRVDAGLCPRALLASRAFRQSSSPRGAEQLCGCHEHTCIARVLRLFGATPFMMMGRMHPRSLASPSCWTTRSSLTWTTGAWASRRPTALRTRRGHLRPLHQAVLPRSTVPPHCLHGSRPQRPRRTSWQSSKRRRSTCRPCSLTTSPSAWSISWSPSSIACHVGAMPRPALRRRQHRRHPCQRLHQHRHRRACHRCRLQRRPASPRPTCGWTLWPWPLQRQRCWWRSSVLASRSGR
mmetsp:Transcript_108198/g.316436  ORF Transcript_108198/g.316436 Transcript_108198/m.316436 type:complete len:253 (+) Transcript_108198:814-1572(+)